MHGLIDAGLSPASANAAAGALSIGVATAVGAAAGGVGGEEGAFNQDANNRILHPTDTVNAHLLAAQSGGKYSAQEVADALRWAGVRDANGHLVYAPGSGQSYSQGTGQTYGAQSPTGTVAGDMTYDPGLTLRPNGQALNEVLPPAPSTDLMSYIVSNTGGAQSP